MMIDKSPKPDPKNNPILGLDSKSKKMLRFIAEKEKTNTTEIKEETSLTRGQINYRYDKLENNDLINTESKNQEEQIINPPTKAEITDKGRSIAEEITIETHEIEKLEKRIEEIENKQEELNEKISETKKKTRTNEEKLSKTIDGIRAIKSYLEDKNPQIKFEKYIRR